MRILAIRGCNLASLAGEFEIDLAHGALGAAGVFAIVGPTGAGKSTLLDAMCVALFDRTPRLANRSTVIVGRGDDDPTALGAQDVRSLLRRGASAGYAEVDFESGDARRYRARWSVRRARGATDGRFQNQQVTLTAIGGSNEAIGGTKTETLDAIHQRLGLSFDQFRRSALLAQGEFAAFLRADGKDRSELLERMTGTEIYSKLSIAAHLKATLAEQQLRERHGAALAIAVLADDERASAESELVLAKQAQTITRARLTTAEAARRWQLESERRAGAVVEAEASRVEVERAVEAATAERAELALRRRAEALRAPFEEASRLDRQLAIVRGEAATAGQAADQAAAAQREIAAIRGQLVALHAPIREARIAAGLVELDLASYPERDTQRDLAGARASGDLHAGAGARANGDLHSGAGARARPRGDLVPRATAAAADAAWLLARRDLGPAIGSWRDLDARLALHTALAGEIAAADKILDDRARKRAQLATQRAAAVAEHQQSLARLTEAQAEAASYQQKRSLSLDAARRAEDEARRRCTELDRLVAIAGEARGAATAHGEFARQLAELATAATVDARARAAAEAERDRAALLRAERSRVLDELRKAAGYTHARTELVDGDPCPLCGALEHPWHDRGAFDALIGDAQARLTEVTILAETAIAALATLDARAAQRTKEDARLTSCRATADATLAAARRTWREHLAALGELLLVDDPATPAAQQLADERIVAARAKLEAARAARSQAEAAAKAAGEAQARVQTRQADVEHHVHALRELDAAIASVDAAAERLRGERTGKTERHRDLLVAVDDSLATWHAALTAADAARPLLALARDALLASGAIARADRGQTLPGRVADAARAVAVETAAPAIQARVPRKRSRTKRTAEHLADPSTSGAAISSDAAAAPTATATATAAATAAATASAAATATATPTATATATATAAATASAAAAATAAATAAAAAAPAAAATASAAATATPTAAATASQRAGAPAALPHAGTTPVRGIPLDAHASALLDRCRIALAEVATAWGAHAAVIATLDAELAAAIASGDFAAREAERVLAEQLARRDAALSRRDTAIAELADASAKLDTARIASGFDSEELRRLLTDPPSRAEALAEQLEALDRAADRARTLVAERRRLVDDHAATLAALVPVPAATESSTTSATMAIAASSIAQGAAGATTTSFDDGAVAASSADVAIAATTAPGDSGAAAATRGLPADLLADAARILDLEAAVTTADHQAAALAATLAADADARTRRTAALAQFVAAEQAAEVDRVLGEVIGSHDGKLFRSFAQSLTLDGLLAVANSHLEELSPRYQLERVPKHDLELQVIDRDLGNEIRSVQSLSGGESFLVSLALALGLSSMSAHDVRVRTLLIDEGFGTLDPATLDGALAVLDALQATGRQVGVISHVPALVERVGAHVRVSPRGGGRSEVVVAEA